MRLVRVPLTGCGEVVLLAKDFDRLRDLGLSPMWSTRRSSPGSTYVRCPHPAVAAGKRSTLSVARLIMGAPPGMAVHYADGDRCNLRRDNLSLTEDKRARGQERGVLQRLRQRKA